MRISRSVLAASLVAMVVGSQSARAEFTYSSTVNATNTFGEPDPGTTPPPGATGSISVVIGNGNSLLFTSDFPPPATSPMITDIPGGSDVTFGHVSFVPSATNTTLTQYAVNFNYQLTIRDVLSGDSGLINYTGRESGFAMGGPATGSAINSTFLFAVAPSTLTLDGKVYNFTAHQPTGPGSVGGVLTDGAFSLNISTRAVPEPGSIALLGIGLGGMGLIARRHLLKKAQATEA
ncbi:MAG: hypothetical protein JWN86_3806 [Planctomycetota bacterium]|nr:hypothetical protein [Planctomycetota bacterium]